MVQPGKWSCFFVVTLAGEKKWRNTLYAILFLSVFISIFHVLIVHLFFFKPLCMFACGVRFCSRLYILKKADFTHLNDLAHINILTDGLYTKLLLGVSERVDLCVCMVRCDGSASHIQYGIPVYQG